MRVLLTGGAGFIGSHVAHALIEAGHEVTVLDDLSSGRPENVPKEARFIEADIRSSLATRALRELAPEALVHHAAQVDVRRSVVDPAFDVHVNVLGTLSLLEACVESGTKRVVFASTGGAIYGEQERFPAEESHPIRPISPYGCSKAAAELLLGYYGRIHGLSWLSLRYANVYGPGQDPTGEAGVVASFCTKLLNEETCTVFGDGRQTRDYVFVGDVARANVLALESDHQGPLNIGTGLETDVLELHALLSEAAGVSCPPRHAPARPGEQLRSSVDYSLAEQVLGWRPEIDLAKGAALTLEHFRRVTG